MLVLEYEAEAGRFARFTCGRSEVRCSKRDGTKVVVEKQTGIAHVDISDYTDSFACTLLGIFYPYVQKMSSFHLSSHHAIKI